MAFIHVKTVISLRLSAEVSDETYFFCFIEMTSLCLCLTSVKTRFVVVNHLLCRVSKLIIIWFTSVNKTWTFSEVSNFTRAADMQESQHCFPANFLTPLNECGVEIFLQVEMSVVL